MKRSPALVTLTLLLCGRALAQTEAPPASVSVTAPEPGYPVEYVQRPLTLPASMFDLRVSLGAELLTQGPGGAASAAVRYGVTSWFELSATSAFTQLGTSNADWRGVGLGAMFALLKGGTELAVGVTGQLQPLSSQRVLDSIALDLPFRVRFGNLSLTAGQGLLRYHPGAPGLGNSSFGSVNLAVNAAYQLHRHVAVSVGSTLVTVYGLGFLTGVSVLFPLTAALVVSPSAQWDLAVTVSGPSIETYPSAQLTVAFRP